MALDRAVEAAGLDAAEEKLFEIYDADSPENRVGIRICRDSCAPSSGTGFVTTAAAPGVGARTASGVSGAVD
jgi:hypothetical protein